VKTMMVELRSPKNFAGYSFEQYHRLYEQNGWEVHPS
jgi:hypothetical protein